MFKALIALCWTPVTPTGKQKSSQTFLENAEALIFALALRIASNFFGSSGYEPCYSQVLELMKQCIYFSKLNFDFI